MEIKREHIILTKQEYEQLLQTNATLEATVKAQREIINKQQENIKKTRRKYTIAHLKILKIEVEKRS
jgi:hypothetical protein